MLSNILFVRYKIRPIFNGGGKKILIGIFIRRAFKTRKCKIIKRKFFETGTFSPRESRGVIERILLPPSVTRDGAKWN